MAHKQPTKRANVVRHEEPISTAPTPEQAQALADFEQSHKKYVATFTKVIDGEEKAFVFDPDEVFLRQAERIEKILLSIGYHALQEKLLEEISGSDLMREFAEAKVEVEKIAAAKQGKKLDEKTLKLLEELTKRGMDLRTKLGRKHADMRSQLHAALVNNDVREDLVCYMVVTEESKGSKWSMDQYVYNKKHLAPLLKLEEVEYVLSAFFTSSGVSKGAFHLYLDRLTPLRYDEMLQQVKEVSLPSLPSH